MTGITDLPIEIFTDYILSFLPVSDILHLAQTCRVSTRSTTKLSRFDGDSYSSSRLYAQMTRSGRFASRRTSTLREQGRRVPVDGSSFTEGYTTREVRKTRRMYAYILTLLFTFQYTYGGTFVLNAASIGPSSDSCIFPGRSPVAGWDYRSSQRSSSAMCLSPPRCVFLERVSFTLRRAECEIQRSVTKPPPVRLNFV